MKKITWIVVCVVIIGALFVIAKNFRVADEKVVVRIGASESLSGNAVYYGESTKKGVDLGMDWLREKYPDIKFEIYHEDNKFDPKASVDAYHNLKTLHSIDAIITHSSPASIATQPLAKADGILQMAVSAGVSKYTSPDDLSFRTTGSAQLEAIPLIAHINKNYKNVAILYMNNEVGLSIATAVSDGIKKSALSSVLSFDAFDVTRNDFRTELIKIKKDNPDAIFIGGLTSHILVVLRQMKELGIDVQPLTFRTGDDQTLIKNGGELVEGLIFSSNFADESDNPEVVDFVRRFEEKYKEKPNSYAAEGYEGVRFVGMAFDECGKDYACIKNYLSTIKDANSLFGKISFNVDGDVSYNFFLKAIVDGKFSKLNY